MISSANRFWLVGWQALATLYKLSELITAPLFRVFREITLSLSNYRSLYSQALFWHKLSATAIGGAAKVGQRYPAYQPFIEKVLQLAKQFQTKKFEDLIQQYLVMEPI